MRTVSSPAPRAPFNAEFQASNAELYPKTELSLPESSR